MRNSILPSIGPGAMVDEELPPDGEGPECFINIIIISLSIINLVIYLV